MSDAVLSFNLMVATRRKTSSQVAVIDVLIRFYRPAGTVAAPARPEHVEILLFQVLYAGSEADSQQVSDRENGLGKAMRVGGMNVAFDHVVAHEAVNDICALAFRRAENQRMPEQVALIDESVSADALAFAKIFEGMVGVERVGPHLEFLAVAGGMNFIPRTTIYVGQLHGGHETRDPIVSRMEVFQGKAPAYGAVEFGDGERSGDLRHLRRSDCTSKADDPCE